MYARRCPQLLRSLTLAIPLLGVGCSATPQALSPTEPTEASLSAVRVDQHGYLPTAPKIALWVSEQPTPAAWQLLDAQGQVVASGNTTFQGPDQESGDTLHLLDFSSYQQEGRGYRLAIGKELSRPFAIDRDLYNGLFVDSARYFYLNRSGVALTMPFVGEAQWARAAGHVSDRSVPCLPASGCDYSLDVHGGWYDAGDYGKYVVNGGIAAWLLLNAYELSSTTGRAQWFGDNQLNLPESGNAVADLLDEARFEIEFLLRMQVPEGNPLAGLVHHKMHDAKWSAMGLPPTEHTDVPRYLHPPSTAAALNVAAVGAMAGRVYASVDSEFAERCLSAARRAYAAALAHPNLLAPGDSHTGGGPYGDEQLSDDFYWAAAELFVTTGDSEFGEALRGSPHFTKLSSQAGGYPVSFDWATTDALGSISLLLNEERLLVTERDVLRAQLLLSADRNVELIRRQGYHLPFAAGDAGYPWGSNSFVTDNAIVLAMAHQQTGDAKYLEAAYEGLHYVLGRNANDFSYISGYGDHSLTNPHHRFWAHSVNAQLPGPPPGALSGGPNSNPTDPPMKQQRSGCVFQKCYLDDLGAYSVNEVAINWNASLVWLAAYFAQH